MSIFHKLFFAAVLAGHCSASLAIGIDAGSSNCAEDPYAAHIVDAENFGLNLLQKEAVKRIQKKPQSSDSAEDVLSVPDASSAVVPVTAPLSEESRSFAASLLESGVSTVMENWRSDSMPMQNSTVARMKAHWVWFPASHLAYMGMPGLYAWSWWTLAIYIVIIGGGLLALCMIPTRENRSLLFEPAMDIKEAHAGMCALIGTVVAIVGIVMCCRTPTQFWGLPVLDVGVLLLDVPKFKEMHIKTSSGAVFWISYIATWSITICIFVWICAGLPGYWAQFADVFATCGLMICASAPLFANQTKFSIPQKMSWFGLLLCWLSAPVMEFACFMLDMGYWGYGWLKLMYACIPILVIGIIFMMLGDGGNQEEMHKEEALAQKYSLDSLQSRSPRGDHGKAYRKEG